MTNATEKKLRRMIDAVADGRVSRRSFIQKLVALGLSAPMASQMLMHAGVAQAQGAHKYLPTKRGGGGAIKLLWWQGPTLLNPHFAVGSKDQDSSRIFYEPLASWDEDGNIVAVLAAEIPTKENGGLAPDGKSVTWKLKQGVKWHDGKPFTADDVVFNWEYAKDPATAAVTAGSYKDVIVEKIDTHTVKITFKNPTPFWATAFVGYSGMLLPKHHFAEFSGGKSREAPANLKPVGTGPYKFVDFKPGDLVKGEINTDYHIANMPHFDTVEVKGGGDAVSAARSVIQSGEFDFAWNMQVEDEILLKMEQGGKGKTVLVAGGNIEHIGINFADPWTEIDGERASLKSKHPTLNDKAVRQALSLLVDRGSVEKFIYGRTGQATANFVNNPERHRSKNTKFEFNVDKANEILDKAGWLKGADGIRAKDGRKLKFVFQTSINAPRQKTQAIVKQACQKAGIDLELKSVVASVYFSSDVANPDTYTKFYCDLQMFTTSMGQPDAELFLQQFLTAECSTKDNKWQGRNFTRYRNPDYDKLHASAVAELDPVKRAAILIKCNDMAVEDVVVVPIVYRPGAHAMSLRLKGQATGWDTTLAFLNAWYREA